jgi:hypothetical protein
LYEKQPLDELTGREEEIEAIARRNLKHRHIPQIQRRRWRRMRRRTQIQRGGGALRSRGGGGLRSREGLTYLVGAAIIVLISSGRPDPPHNRARWRGEEGRKEARDGSNCWTRSAAFFVESSCVRLRQRVTRDT